MRFRNGVWVRFLSGGLAAITFGCSEEIATSEMTFAEVPAGVFMMGSPSHEAGRSSDEGPRHEVRIESFEIMTTEVTQGMWQREMGVNPASERGVGKDYPVYNVSWQDCGDFIRKLNQRDDGYMYRLPTEAEWEYACRAGTATRYYWGEDPDACEIDDHAWYRDNSGEGTHPVARREPNAWGLYDMSGNVWEWCRDSWHDDYIGAPSDGGAWESPGSNQRVSRGGSWIGDANQCRSAYRFLNIEDLGWADQGFRLVRTRGRT